MFWSGTGGGSSETGADFKWGGAPIFWHTPFRGGWGLFDGALGLHAAKSQRPTPVSAPLQRIESKSLRMKVSDGHGLKSHVNRVLNRPTSITNWDKKICSKFTTIKNI